MNRPLRICLIGPGDIPFHYYELLQISEQELYQHLHQLAQVLADTNTELVLLPDRGVAFELAKYYKQCTDKKIYGTVPLSDTDFGINHLQPYLDATINGKKVIDTLIDTGTWYKQDLLHCTFGDIILMLGNSLGAHGELDYGFYLYKLFGGGKPAIAVQQHTLHAAIRAGTIIPFTVILYQPFLKDKLHAETEAYIKKCGGVLYYIQNAAELRTLLATLTSAQT